MTFFARTFTRRRTLVGAAVALVAQRFPGLARAAGATGSETVTRLQLRTVRGTIAKSHPQLTTVSPVGPSGRTAAVLGVGLSRVAHLQLDVINRNRPGVHAAAAEGGIAGAGATSQRLVDKRFGPGQHHFTWTPAADTTPGTYSLVLTATDRSGKRTVFGAASPAHPALARAPIVRVVGVEGAFTKRSYLAGDTATLELTADAGSVAVQVFQAGPEPIPTYSNNTFNGVAVSDPVTVPWGASIDAPTAVPVPIGAWASGLYYARIATDDGRIGFAPFVVRPAAPTRRVAVVLPTNTWQAYNFHDRDVDGFGDSWYVAWAIKSIDLTRPHLNRGVPYRFRAYDLAFLHWLSKRGLEVDFYADDDLYWFANGDALRAAYDLVVFPGHEEYVTEHAFDVVERYRDLGGNLMLLSANNFFRRVDPRGDHLTLVGLWRDLGRPESALLGNQYRASDRGTHQSAFVVTQAGADSGLFDGTGLGVGSTFGRYGIEIDATTASSPPGTQVLAEIPDLLGPGLTAQMTYYETPAGARVFAAGVLNFNGELEVWDQPARLVENVWDRLTA
jgi:hypothetical protein